MSISADFTVGGSARTGTHVVAYGASVTLALLSFTGVSSVDWDVAGTSHGDVAPSLTPGGVPSGSTCVVTMPSDPGGGEGRSAVVRCTVTDQAGARNVRTCVLGALNSKSRLPLTAGETIERSASVGWASLINTLLNA